jgi:hypothetical protein
VSQIERNWLSLFRAVGLRDAAGMVEHARTLLKGKKTLVGEAGRYILAAGMLGSIVSGDHTGARDLWNSYGDKLRRTNKKSITLDLLKALAENNVRQPD